MDREAVEKLAMDMEKKRMRWEGLSQANVFGLTTEERVAQSIAYAEAYAAFLSARNKYLDAVV